MSSTKRRIVFFIAAYLTIYLGCFYFLESPLFGIRINQTPSLPYKLFVSVPFQTIKKYSYVSLCHPSAHYPLAKQIIGIPGDQILLQNKHVFVNEHDCGRALHVTSSGISLTPIEMREIPEGYVFVHAPHAESFDSRYQQFGLVPITQLEEALWPIY